MKSVLLIAGNFVREQRLVALLLVAYAVVASLFFGMMRETSIEDMSFVLKQELIYAIFFSGFIALSSIHNERKTRRLLSVLSKAVTRGQYIAGLLAGVQAITLLYSLVIWLGGVWMLWGRGAIGQLTIMTVASVITALLTASVALFFASFLPPIVATAAAGLLILLPVGLARTLGPAWMDVLPIYTMVLDIAKHPMSLRWWPQWQVAAITVLEAVVFWLLAAMIFSTRDVAVAVE